MINPPNQHLEIKRNEEDISTKDLSDYTTTSALNKLKWIIEKIKQNKTVTAIVAGVCLLAAIFIPIIHMPAEDYTIDMPIYISEQLVTLKIGASMKSSLAQVHRQSKKLNLTINEFMSPTKRVLQVADPTPKHICFYHKDSQILVCFGNNFTAHIRVPEKGIDFVIPQVPQSSQQAFFQMPKYLPIALIKALSQASGKEVTISTDVSYDGIYNKARNEYTLLTHKKPYHPESFGRIEPDQVNLLEIKPTISNFSDIIEVTSKIAAVVSNIVYNTQLIIQSNEKLKKYIEPLQDKQFLIKSADNEQEIPSQADKILKCGRLGPEVMRCPESVWRSGLLNVVNIEDADPIEIWEIVIDVQ